MIGNRLTVGGAFVLAGSLSVLALEFSILPPGTTQSAFAANRDKGEERPKFEPVPAGRPVCGEGTRRVVRPAVECGFNDIGAPNPGVFVCGQKPKADFSGCEDYCQFVECREP